MFSGKEFHMKAPSYIKLFFKLFERCFGKHMVLSCHEDCGLLFPSSKQIFIKDNFVPAHIKL